MYDQGKRRPMIAYLIVLGVALALTLALFSFLFLRGFFQTGGHTGGTTGGSTPGDDPPSEETARQMAEHMALKQQYEQALASPYLLVVSEASPLPEDYTCDLVPLDQDPLMSMEVFAAAKLQQFLAEARQAGYTPYLLACYRSPEAQDAVFNEAVQSYMSAGYLLDKARELAAREQGTSSGSEHLTGLAVDLTDTAALTDPSKTEFAEYAKKNLPRFGFVQSYPEGKESITGRPASETHYRYVGVDAAQEMTQRGLTLEEYRDYLVTQVNYQQQCIDALQKAG